MDMMPVFTREDLKDEKKSSWWEGMIAGFLMGFATAFLGFVAFGTYLEIAYPQ